MTDVTTELAKLTASTTELTNTVVGKYAALDSKVEAAGDSADDAAASATASANSADGAAASAIAAANSAIDSATSGSIYETTAAGLTATIDGAYFSVVSVNDNNYLDLHKNESGVAVYKKSYPSSEGVDSRLDFVEINSNVSSFEMAITDLQGNAPLVIHKDGEVEVTNLKTQHHLVESVTAKSINMTNVEIFNDGPLEGAAFADENGLTSVVIGGDGSVIVSNLNSYGPIKLEDGSVFESTNSDKVSLEDYKYVITDEVGTVCFGVFGDGSVQIPKLVSSVDRQLDVSAISYDATSSDTIVLIGDSYTSSHYTIKDQSYISMVSALTDYKVNNFGISGNDGLDMNYRIVNDISYFDGLVFSDKKPKYAFIAAYTNDGQFRSADLNMWKFNMNRLITSVKACGTIPILFSEFPINMNGLYVLQQLAKEHDIQFVDGHSLNKEVGSLKKGPFHQGHPGTRSNGVFWIPMVEAIDKLPKPSKAVKIFRKRKNVNINDISDLLYSGVVERHFKFKELSVTHHRLNDANVEFYDELDGDNVYDFTLTRDEYDNLGRGGVNVDDYSLVEITLPAKANSLTSLKIQVDATEGTDLFVRNFLDSATSPGGRAQGASPTQPDYLSKWQNNIGSWDLKSLVFSVQGQDLHNYLVGDKIQIILHKPTGFNLGNVTVSFKGNVEQKRNPNQFAELKISDTQLLDEQKVDSASLGNWDVIGTVNTLVPIDNYNSPRDPDNYNNPVTEVCVLNETNAIKQTVDLTPNQFSDREYLVRVWARNFPKAFLDNSVYNLDPNQVIDKSDPNVSYETHSLINENTHNLKVLQLRCSAGSELSETDSILNEGFVALQWRHVDFRIRVPKLPFGQSKHTIELSSKEGEIQIAKVQLMEIL